MFYTKVTKPFKIINEKCYILIIKASKLKFKKLKGKNA